MCQEFFERKLILYIFFYQTRNVEQKSCSRIFPAVQELCDVGEQRCVDLDLVLQPLDASNLERTNDVTGFHET